MATKVELFEYKDVYSMDLHEQIIFLKKMAKQINTQDILQLENIEKIIEMKRIVEVMDIPIVLSEG
jgi:hypothetical protein